MLTTIKMLGKEVIGIDELNNAFHLNRDFKIKFPMLVSAYLIRNYRGSTYHQTPYSGKKKSFTFKGHSKEEILRRARLFLERNPDFFYTAIDKSEFSKKEKARKRAEAMALLTFNFILRYNLPRENIAVVMDKIDSGDFSSDVSHQCKEIFKMAGLAIPIKIQEHADKLNPAVRNADRAAYHIGAIKFRCKVERWPKRERKVDINNLIDLLLEIKHPSLSSLDELV